MLRRMRFAIKTSPQHTTWDDMLAVWQAADDIDMFESAWTFDHFYPIFSDPTGPASRGGSPPTALAQATRRMRVGVLVTGNLYRHPAVLANMAATLDVISRRAARARPGRRAGTRRSATPTASSCRRSRSGSTASTRRSR